MHRCHSRFAQTNPMLKQPPGSEVNLRPTLNAHSTPGNVETWASPLAPTGAYAIDRSRPRYCTASLTCAGSMASKSARSAMVRAILSTR